VTTGPRSPPSSKGVGEPLESFETSLGGFQMGKTVCVCVLI